jgi:AraC-like DNA-binding protein
LSSGHGVLNSPPGSEISAKVLARDLSPLKAGGGGAITRFVCGYLSCDPLLCRPLLAGLPQVFTVNLRTEPSGQWLESAFLNIVGEAASSAVGSQAMLARLSEALFVDTLRRYIARLPEQETGLPAAARDAVVGKSLSLSHARVTHPWTIAELARDVGISRSALVERFTRYLADPPMTYLTKWRLQLVAGLLTTSPRGLPEVAADVGYQSEAAFNRAFKRAFGHSPARHCREQGQSPRRGHSLPCRKVLRMPPVRGPADFNIASSASHITDPDGRGGKPGSGPGQHPPLGSAPSESSVDEAPSLPTSSRVAFLDPTISHHISRPLKQGSKKFYVDRPML